MEPPQKKPDIISREVEGETVLLNEENEEIHQLNHTASFIWKCCNGENTVDDIVKLLHDEFHTESIDIRNDVINIISSLKKLNLIDE